MIFSVREVAAAEGSVTCSRAPAAMLRLLQLLLAALCVSAVGFKALALQAEEGS